MPLSVVLSGEGSDYAKVEFEVFTRGPGRLYEDKDMGIIKADKSSELKKLTTFTNNKGNDDGNANTAQRDTFKPNRWHYPCPGMGFR